MAAEAGSESVAGQPLTRPTRLPYDSDPILRRAVRREGALVWLALWWKFAIFGLFLVPMWDVPDETGHFAYISALQEGSIGPFTRDGARMGEAVAELSAHREGTRNWIVQHPPAYYATMAPLLALFRIAGLDFTAQFFGLRVASSGLAALGFAVVFVAARRIGVRTESALLAVVLLSIAPSATAVFSGVSNDGAVFLVAALVIASFAKAFVPFTDGRFLVLSVAALGLGVATKGFFLIWIAGLGLCLAAVSALRALARHGVGVGRQSAALIVAAGATLLAAPVVLRGFASAERFALAMDPPTNLVRVLVRQRSLSDFFVHYVGLIGWGGRGTMSFPNSTVLAGGFVALSGVMFFIGVAVVIWALGARAEGSGSAHRLYSVIRALGGAVAVSGVVLLLNQGSGAHDRRIAAAAFLLLSLLLLHSVLVAANGCSSVIRLVALLSASAVISVAATIVYISAPQVLGGGFDPAVNIRASHGRYMFVALPATLFAVGWSLDRVVPSRRVLLALSAAGLAWEIGILTHYVHPFYYGAG